jgi:hypothetical protein
MIVVAMKIEWPVIYEPNKRFVLDGGRLFHDMNWQPDRRYWSGRIVRGLPMPLQAPMDWVYPMDIMTKAGQMGGKPPGEPKDVAA